MPTAIATTVLAGLGLTNAPATPAGATPPAPMLMPAAVPGVVAGTVTTSDGGWDRTLSPNPRVVVAIAPETTLRSVAMLVQGWLAALGAGQQPVPTVAGTGRALLAYHQNDLDLASLLGSGAAISPARFPAWMVGRLLTLPIEFDATAGTPTLTTDPALWSGLGATLSAGAETLLDYLPVPLTLPDFAADDAYAKGLIDSAAVLTDLVPALRTAVLTNPSAEVYRVLALLRYIDQAAPDAGAAFLTALVAAFSADELALLATMRPGAIVLRAVLRRLTPQPDALLAALGFPPMQPVDLTTVASPVVARELPVSTAWRMRPEVVKPARPHRDASGEPDDGWHDVVSGRSLACGKVSTSVWGGISYRGPAFAGKPGWSAGTWLTANRAELNPGNDLRLDARLDIVAVIAPNEGNVDAVRQQDGALLALGIQQWSADSDTELTLLLWQLLQQYPDEYDAHFGLHGLGLTLTGSYPDGTPQSVSMSQITTTGRTAMPARASTKVAPAERLAFYDGFAISPTEFQWIKPDDPTRLSRWPALIRNAELCSRGLQRLELLEAGRRLTKIVGQGWHFHLGTPDPAIDHLVTSEQAVAQMLDQHINNPRLTLKSLRTAVQQTTLPLQLDQAGYPSVAWRTAFEAAYLQAVSYPPGIAVHDVKDQNGKVVQRGRQDRILAAGLSALPGSFQGW